MYPKQFIDQQRSKLLELQKYYTQQSQGNGGVENLSSKSLMLSQIRDALELINYGEYGSCEDCGESIPQKRLAMIPQATRCAPCQEIIEKHTPQLRRSLVESRERNLR
jgi:phage/conjugal plasmid C-4 type zinc finger TraR family protein